MGERWVQRSGEDYKGQIRTGDGGRRCGLKKECGGAEGKRPRGAEEETGRWGRVKIGVGGRESVWKVNLKTQGISIGKTKSED